MSDTKNDLVTVITAVRNGEAHIEDSIKSVLSQSHRNIEYLIYDACSTDQTNRIIEKYADRIALHISEPDRGLAEAWNKGLRRAKGKYIALLNADDFYADDFIEKSLSSLGSNLKSIAYGSTVLIDPETQRSRLRVGTFSKQRLGVGFGFLHTSCLVPADVYRSIGEFNEAYRIGMDTDFLLRCVKGGIEFSRSEAVNYMRGGGMSRKYLAKARLEYRQSLVEHDFYRQFWWQERLQYYRLKILSWIGSGRTAGLKGQLRFLFLFLFNFVYNYCFSHTLRRLMLRGTGCMLGDRSLIHPKARFFSMGRIRMGQGSVVCCDCYLDNRHPINIGDNVMIAHGTKIYTTGHVLDCPYFRGFGREVSIGNRAVLFSNASVMPGVSIGEGAVVLSGAVVTKNVEPYQVVGGNPAIPIRIRNSDLRYRLDYHGYFSM